MNIYKENYQSIKPLLLNEDLIKNNYAEIQVKGYMPLVIEKIAKGYDYYIISLAHIYTYNYDTMADPEMELKVFPNESIIKAISYKQSRYNMYQRIEDSKKTEFELNLFLKTWLTTLKLQGFIKEEV